MLHLTHFVPALLAQTGADPSLADTGPNPIGLFDAAVRRNLDVLNHPETLADVLTQINIVWAGIFVVIGGMCVLHGYRWHKILLIVLAGLLGVWAGVTVGEHVGTPEIASACLGGLFAVLAWPLLRYAVALFGGLAGAFAGANVWTALGHDPSLHYMGALLGLVIVGMLAFMTYRPVVIILTTIGGASLLVFGAIAAMLHVEGWRGGMLEAMQANTLLIPIVVASAAAFGAVFQFGGGMKGMNEMANKADKSKAKAATQG